MNEHVIKSWPRLYKTSSTDKELQWDIYVRITTSELGFDIVTVHGQVDGQLQTSVVNIKQGKNKGRKNETSAETQACLEAEAKWKKQLDKCYSQERGGAAKTYKPMLAQTYEDHKDKVEFPCCIQPKLDGNRCIAIRYEEHVELLSRNGKPYLGLDHIRTELLMAMSPGEVWDGEVYCHGMTFQEMMSLIKKPQASSEALGYHIYDVIHDEPFPERIARVNHLKKNNGLYKHLHRVETHSVDSHEQVSELYKHFVSLEYEGAMLRVGDCTYRENARSKQLLKIKQWIDAEFEIIDVGHGIGKMENQAIFVCKTAEGIPFSVKCKGDDASREEQLANKENYIGKMLTVKFFEMTTSTPSVPRFPIGLRLREDV